jgi:NADH:ubiquinone oxidoreductase subunit 4 (subunit M)
LANFQYERNLRRQLVLVRGQGHNFYYVSGLWVIFLFINFSVPPFLSLLGELEVVIALFSFNCYYFFILGLVIFFVAAYCVYCFRTMVHGIVAPLKSTLGEQDMIYLILIFHFFPLIFLVFKIDLLFL